MSGLEIVGIVIAVMAALGVVALVGALILRALATKPDRFSVRPMTVGDIDEYFARRASLAIRIEETTPLSRRDVWQRLTEAAYLSNLPLMRGPQWSATSGAQGDGVVIRSGARRSMSGTFVAVSEQVIDVAERERLAFTGDGVSISLAVKNFAERFTIVDGERSGTVTVTWEIAGSPRWVGFLPWRWTAPLLRPVFGFVLRHMLRLMPFARSAVRDSTTS